MGPNLELLTQQAIKAAINQDWAAAISYNQIIIEYQPQDIPAHNRLGTAFIRSNQPAKAKEPFLAVLKLDPHNPIAKNCLSQIKKNALPTNNQLTEGCLISFIEEPGKSKVLPLTNIAEPQVITSLSIGQKVELKPSRRRLSVIDNLHHHLGYLPDNISLHLLKLIKSGYHYEVYIKSTNLKNFQVFIRELKQSKKLKGTPSFSVNGDIFPKLDAGEPNHPPLEIYDPLVADDMESY